MTTLQIIGFIGLGIILIGAIFLAKERFIIGIILMTIGAITGMTGAIGHQVELYKDTPNRP